MGAERDLRALDELREWIALEDEIGRPVVLRLDREPHPATRRLMAMLGVPVVVTAAAPPILDCAAGECVYERACPLDGRCIVRERQEGEAMLEQGDGRAALDAMDRGLPQQAAETPAAAKRQMRPRGYWTRERIIERFQEWAAEHGRAPTATEWFEPSGGVNPAVSKVRELFGSWTKGVAAAGLQPPGRRRASDSSTSSEEPDPEVARAQPPVVEPPADEVGPDVVEAPPRPGCAAQPDRRGARPPRRARGVALDAA